MKDRPLKIMRYAIFTYVILFVLALLLGICYALYIIISNGGLFFLIGLIAIIFFIPAVRWLGVNL